MRIYQSENLRMKKLQINSLITVIVQLRQELSPIELSTLL